MAIGMKMFTFLFACNNLNIKKLHKLSLCGHKENMKIILNKARVIRLGMIIIKILICQFLSNAAVQNYATVGESSFL